MAPRILIVDDHGPNIVAMKAALELGFVPFDRQGGELPFNLNLIGD